MIKRLNHFVKKKYYKSLYPVHISGIAALPESSISERIRVSDERTLVLPDVGKGETRVKLNKKEIRVLSDVTFWPSLSIAQVSKNTLDKECEIDEIRLKKVVERKEAFSYPIKRFGGYITSIDCAPHWWNYYHWYIESLPRIWSLHHSAIQKYGQITLLTSRNLRKNDQQLLQALLPSNVTLKKVSRYLRARGNYIDLPILSEYGFGYLPKEYVEFYRKKVFTYLGLPMSPQKYRKLYISREGVHRRYFLNGDEVSKFLSDKGYEKHTMQGLSIREQVALFSSASHIISSHGAALTNMLYTPNGAEILEIHHSQNNPTRYNHYQTLAFSLDHNYKTLWLNAKHKHGNVELPLHKLDQALSLN